MPSWRQRIERCWYWLTKVATPDSNSQRDKRLISPSQWWSFGTMARPRIQALLLGNRSVSWRWNQSSNSTHVVTLCAIDFLKRYYLSSLVFAHWWWISPVSIALTSVTKQRVFIAILCDWWCTMIPLADMAVGAISKSYRSDGRKNHKRWRQMPCPKIEDIWNFK